METIRPSHLRQQARTALKGYWNVSAFVVFCYLFIMLCISTISTLSFETVEVQQLVYGILAILFCPLGIALNYIFQDLFTASVKPTPRELFAPFCRYGRYLGCYLLMMLFVCLWTLLLIIPGIIKGLAYSMTYYILRENPDMTISQAIHRSRMMMKGHKMELFILNLTFIGWTFLAAITLIGIFWLIPYLLTTYATFYEKVKTMDATSAAAPETV